MLLLALLAAWIAAGSQAGSRLAASFALPHLLPGSSLAVQAWITPPRWTGQSPILIDREAKTVDAVAGSALSVIVTGAGGSAPFASVGGHRLGLTRIDRGSYRATQTLSAPLVSAPVLSAPVKVLVGPFWHRAARFSVIVTAVAAPVIGFVAPPSADPDGRHLDVDWQAHSPFGLSSLALVMRPVATPAAAAERAALPFGRTLSGTAKLDLLASPYAGLAVSGVLHAVNAGGVAGRSAPAAFTLPMPQLRNRTAQALEAVRRELAIAPEHRDAMAAQLSAIGAAPPGTVTPATAAAIRQFAANFAAKSAKAVDPEAQLWTLVQRAEQGEAYRSAQQLAAARRALEQALDKALAGHAAEASQLQSLLNQLGAASQAHLSALAHQSGMTPATGAMQQMAAIRQLAQRIAQEAAAGNIARAQQDMAKLRQMLQQLQQAQPMSAARKAQLQQMQQAQQALSRMVQAQSKLLDRTSAAGRQFQPSLFYRDDAQARQRRQEGSKLATPQAGLAKQLQSMATGMAQQGMPSMPQIGQAAGGMKGAAASLRQGDFPGAGTAERAAIGALQRAAGALQSMRLGQGTEGGPSGLGQNAGLGQSGSQGNQSRATVQLGRAGTHSDARQIEDELIKRDAAPALPAPAHRYYHRLIEGNP